jgi:outer membrane lipoprotein-sorting protein
MKKLLLPLIAACLAVRPAGAEEAGKALSAEGAWTRYAERTASLGSWSADYRQLRVLSAFETPVVSTGRLHVLHPSRIRWDQGSPGKAVMTVNGRKGLICPRDGLKATEFELGKDWSPEKLLAPDKKWAERTVKTFDMRLTDSKPDSVSVQLVPRKEALKKALKAVDLTFGRDNWMLLGARIEKPGGEYVRIELTKHDLAPSLTAPFFEFVPPEGTEVTVLKELPDFLVELVKAGD